MEREFVVNMNESYIVCMVVDSYQCGVQSDNIIDAVDVEIKERRKPASGLHEVCGVKQRT